MTRLTPDMLAAGLMPGIEEPTLDRSARQPVADPVWMALRQAQFGEFQAQDAGSPALVRITGDSNPFSATRTPGAPATAYNPQLDPLEPRAEGDPQTGLPDLDAQRVSWGLAVMRILRQHKLAPVARQALTTRFALPPDQSEPGLGDSIAPAAGHITLHGTGGLDGVLLKDAMENAHPRELFDGLDTGLSPLEVETLADALLDWNRSLPEGAHQARWSSETFEGQLDLLAPRGNAPAPTLSATIRNPIGGLATGPNVTLPDGLLDVITDPRPGVPGLEDIIDRDLIPDMVLTDVLTLDGYFGGPLQWWHLRAEPAEALPEQSTGRPAPALDHVVVPTAMRFPGMPGTRLWSVEDPGHHYSALDPAPEDLARLVVSEFAISGAEGWMLAPLRVMPGSVTRVHSVELRDVFGREETRQVKSSATSNDPFDFGGISGTEAGMGALVVMPTAPLMQTGPTLEEVGLRRDPDARLVWAVQSRAPNARTGLTMDGAAAHASQLPAPEPRRAPTDATRAYRIATQVPSHWVPFMMPPSADPTAPRMLTIAALLDAARASAPPLTGQILADLAEFADEAVPPEGVLLNRTARRIRWSDGGVRTWIGRTRAERLPPSGHSGLRYDTLTPLTGPERRPAPTPPELSLRDVMRYGDNSPTSLRGLMQDESGSPTGALSKTLADMARKRTD